MAEGSIRRYNPKTSAKLAKYDLCLVRNITIPSRLKKIFKLKDICLANTKAPLRAEWM